MTATGDYPLGTSYAPAGPETRYRPQGVGIPLAVPFTGPPTDGYWPAGLTIIDATGAIYTSTAAGFPGTWVPSGAYASLAPKPSGGDDTTALSNWLSGLAANTLGLLHPGGGYQTSGTLTVPANVAVFGPATITYTGTADTVVVALGSGATLQFVTVQDTRGYASIPVATQGVSLANGATDVTVAYCTISGHKAAGLAGVDATRLRVIGNRITGIGQISGDTGDGISINRGAGVLIEGNQIDACGRYGIEPYGDTNGDASYYRILGNQFLSNGDSGINAIQLGRSSIVGNTCYNNGQYKNNGGATGGSGIVLSEGASGCHDVTIADNICSTSTEGGIIVQGSAVRVAVTGNVCDSNSFEGIKIASSSQVTVTGNTTTSNASDGIWIYASAQCTVAGNVSEKNAQTGIHLQDGTDHTVNGNTCVDNNQTGPNAAGIQCDGPTGPVGVTITSNTVDSTGATKHLYGIRVYSGNHTAIVGNVTLNTTSGGVQVDSSSGDNTAFNNVGFNPVGLLTVAVPASGTAVPAAAYDRTFYVTASTSTVTMTIQNGTAPVIPASALGTVRVPAGKTVTPTYTAAPTWEVEGE